MNEVKLRRRVGWLLAAAIVATLSPQVGAISGLPDALVMPTGGMASVEVALPLSAEVRDDEAVLAAVDHGAGEALNLTAGDSSERLKWCSGCSACRSRR